MAAGDVSAVAGMEASTFTTPWKENTFHSLLERPGAELWVAELDGEVAAYAILWCIIEEGELANIAVRDDLRGRGIGSELLDWMLFVAEKAGVRNLYLEVRESNEGALLGWDPESGDDLLLRLVSVGVADDGTTATPQSPQKCLPSGTSLAQDGHRSMRKSPQPTQAYTHGDVFQTGDSETPIRRDNSCPCTQPAKVNAVRRQH